MEKQLNKKLHDDERYMGMTESELLKEFGNPDTTVLRTFREYEDEFLDYYHFSENACNENQKVKKLTFSGFFKNYTFWLIKADTSDFYVILMT